MAMLTPITKLGSNIVRSSGRVWAAAGRAAWRELRLALRTPAGRIGLPIVLLHLTLALIGPQLAPYSPTDFHLDNQLEGPSSQFWMGTDEFGRDILSRVIFGARISMIIRIFLWPTSPIRCNARVKRGLTGPASVSILREPRPRACSTRRTK